MLAARVTRTARGLVLATVGVAGLLPCAGASAAFFDPSGFRLSASHYSVNENAGAAVITVERSREKSANAAQIRYITLSIGHPCGAMMCTADPQYDYTSAKREIDFAAGQTTARFRVPIVDHGTDSVPKTIQVSLFGPATWPGRIGLGNPSTAVLTILNNDPPVTHIASNPLALATPPPPNNPLAGATFFVDPDSEPAIAARQYPALNVIARQPGVARFGSFSYGGGVVPTIAVVVSRYLARAAVQQPGAVPMLATYRIVDGHCGHWSDSPGDQLAYHNFITGFAHGIGSYRAVLLLEMDSLITAPCLTAHGVAVRMAELRDAINVLAANCPRLVVYLDAGAADALSAHHTASLLTRAGVAQIQGFFLNSTHFDWTSKEIRYGERISRLTGGKHFIVNTGENGQGPLVPGDRKTEGNEVLCNPPGRGLGPLPTTNTGYRNVDAFAWTSNPGESGGQCVPGAPPTGDYWPQYALALVQHADFAIR